MLDTAYRTKAVFPHRANASHLMRTSELLTLTLNGSIIVLTGVRVYCWTPVFVSLSFWGLPFTRGPLFTDSGSGDAALGTLEVDNTWHRLRDCLCPDVEIA